MPSKDDELIAVVNELRLATRLHIGTVTNRNNSYLNESLRRLVKGKKLYCAASNNPFVPHVYATYDIRKRTGFEHDLPLSDIHVALWSLIVEGEW